MTGAFMKCFAGDRIKALQKPFLAYITVQGFTTLPDLIQEVQTFIRFTCPFCTCLTC